MDISNPRVNELQKVREYNLNPEAMFRFLVDVIFTPSSASRLGCLNLAINKNRAGTQNYRPLFLLCWRQLKLLERRELSNELSIQVSVDVVTGSQIHRQWLSDFTDLKRGAAGPFEQRTPPIDLFTSYLKMKNDVNRDMFFRLWHILSDESSIKILALWLRIFECACVLEPVSSGTKQYLYAKTSEQSQEPLLLSH
jgi:hypothetical protein